jgi:hypothetical protein
MSIKNAIVLFLMTCLLFLAFYFIKDDMIKSNTEIITKDFKYYELQIDSLNNQVDSLNQELFIKQANISNYEMTLELLKEQDSKAADKFQLILNTQTE